MHINIMISCEMIKGGQRTKNQTVKFYIDTAQTATLKTAVLTATNLIRMTM